MFKTEKMEEVVLLDFGIANAFTEYESMKIFGRDPSYCPPEITYENLSNVSSKSDIFSFGIILYELCTERKAFSNTKNKSEIYNLMRSEKFDFFTKFESTGNQQLDTFIKNCLNPDVNQRPTAKEALKQMLNIQIN